MRPCESAEDWRGEKGKNKKKHGHGAHISLSFREVTALAGKRTEYVQLAITF